MAGENTRLLVTRLVNNLRDGGCVARNEARYDPRVFAVHLRLYDHL